MSNPKTLARLAGLLYLLLAVLGGWAHLFARSSLFVRGDAARTAQNIVENEALFRWALVADVLMAVVFVLLGMALTRLLWDVSARLATTLMIFVSVGAGSILVNLTFHVGALMVATDSAYSIGLGSAADTMTLLMLELHDLGYGLGGIFFGLWLLPMGLLAYRSTMFPKVAGVILVVGSVMWLLDPVLAFIPGVPGGVRDIVSIPTSVAEFGLILYLLIVGVLVPKTTAVEKKESLA